MYLRAVSNHAILATYILTAALATYVLYTNYLSYKRLDALRRMREDLEELAIKLNESYGLGQRADRLVDTVHRKLDALHKYETDKRSKSQGGVNE